MEVISEIKDLHEFGKARVDEGSSACVGNMNFVEVVTKRLLRAVQ